MLTFRPPAIVGRRGVCLLFFALLDFVYAFSLCRPAPPQAQAPTTAFLASLAPLETWAWLWLMVGVVCLAGATARRLSGLAFACAAGLKMLWAAVLGLGWALGQVDRGWVTGAVWLAFAVIVMTLAGWPDPPHSEPAALDDSRRDE